MDFLALLFITGLSFFSLLMVLGFWRKVRKQFTHSEIFDLVMFILSIKTLLYFLLPAVLRGYSDWSKDRVIQARPVEIATVYGIEFFSLVVWLITLMLTLTWLRFDRRINTIRIARQFDGPGYLPPISVMSLSKRRVNLFNKKYFTERVAEVFLIAICVLYLWYFPFTLDALLAVAEGEVDLLQPIMWLAGPVVGIYFFSTARRGGYFVYALGLGVTILAVMSAIASGSRGNLVFFFYWLMFLYLFVSNKRHLLYIAVSGAILIVVSQGLMVAIRADESFKDKSIVENVEGMIRFVGTQKDESSLLAELEFRFGEASRMSVGFLRLVDRGDSAGLKPIESATYAMIPRRYFPDKPVQGSVDGTKAGMGMYIIQEVMGHSSNMSEFFTGVHAYWELGFPGVILFAGLSGVFIALCIKYFGTLGYAGLPMMMIVLKPPWLEPKLWSSELIADVFHTLIPLLVLWYLIRWLLIAYLKGRRLFRSGPAILNSDLAPEKRTP
jgi:hypothetical protein